MEAALAQQFKQVENLIDRVAEEAVKEVGRTVFQLVTKGWTEPQSETFGSPVLSGEFYTSWRVSINTPDTSVTPEGRGSPENPLPQLPVNYYDQRVKSVKIGQDIKITNAKPYGTDIETPGFSRKTPQGVARVSVAAAAAKIQSEGLPRTKAIIEREANKR